jgi:hypothetical protein
MWKFEVSGCCTENKQMTNAMNHRRAPLACSSMSHRMSRWHAFPFHRTIILSKLLLPLKLQWAVGNMWVRLLTSCGLHFPLNASDPRTPCSRGGHWGSNGYDMYIALDLRNPRHVALEDGHQDGLGTRLYRMVL